MLSFDKYLVVLDSLLDGILLNLVCDYKYVYIFLKTKIKLIKKIIIFT